MGYNVFMTTHSLLEIGNESPVLVSPTGVHSGCDITIQNVNGSGYIYLGGQGVTTSNYGFRIDPNSAVSFELPGKSALYAIGSLSSMDVAVLTMDLEVGS
jgi:hypothetical protein